jgi:hypothetical protein
MMEPMTDAEMTSKEPAGEDIADLRVGHLVQLIAADSVVPGAGAGGAVALALAAACAGKAVSMSFKHTADPHLGTAAARLQKLASEALAGADADVGTFREWMRNKSVDARDQLIESEEGLARLIEVLSATIRDVERYVQPNMLGDLAAARALAQAAKIIQLTNEQEAKKAQGDR